MSLAEPDPDALTRSLEDPDEALFARVLAVLADDFPLSPADRARLQRLRVALAARGILFFHPGAGRWLAPVFCASPTDQAAFLERYPAVLAPLLAEAAARRAAVDEIAAAGLGATGYLEKEVAAVDAAEAEAAAPRPWWKRLDRDLILLFAGLALALAVLFTGLALALLAPPPAPKTPHTPANPPPVSAPQQTPRAQPDAPAPKETQRLSWPRLAADLSPLLAAAALILYLHNRRRGQLRRDPLRSQAGAIRVALQAALPAFFSGKSVREALAELRRHAAAPGRRLHVRRTLRATARAAGFPHLRFGSRPRVPEYVLLVEREAPRDHLPLLADALMLRMAEEQVAAVRFDFHREPRRLRLAEAAMAPATAAAATASANQPSALPDVVAAFPDARFLVLAEPGRLMSRKAGPADWTQTLAEAGPVVLLNPRAPADWSRDEETLARAGLRILPATAGGVAGYARLLAEDAWDAPARAAVRANAPPSLDLPFHLAARRAELLSEDGLTPRRLEGLIFDLGVWLGEDGLRLLRALAVFPRLEPSLTVLLGRYLKTQGGDRAGDDPILEGEGALLRLARLPWLRAGYMPDILRRALAAGLTDADLATATAVITAFLNEDADRLSGAVPLEVSPAERRRLLERLSRTRAGELNDRILLDALAGRRPAALAFEAPRNLVERIRRAWRAARPASGLRGVSLAGVWRAVRNIWRAIAARLQRLLASEETRVALAGLAAASLALAAAWPMTATRTTAQPQAPPAQQAAEPSPPAPGAEPTPTPDNASENSVGGDAIIFEPTGGPPPTRLALAYRDTCVLASNQAERSRGGALILKLPTKMTVEQPYALGRHRLGYHDYDLVVTRRSRNGYFVDASGVPNTACSSGYLVIEGIINPDAPTSARSPKVVTLPEPPPVAIPPRPSPVPASQTTAGTTSGGTGSRGATSDTRPVYPAGSREWIVYFPFDQTAVTVEGQQVVEGAVKYALGIPGSTIQVVGHTDSFNSAATSMRISERTAENVRNSLIALGVSPNAITTDWKGETQLAVPTGDGVKEPLNRRVEIFIVPPASRSTTQSGSTTPASPQPASASGRQSFPALLGQSVKDMVRVQTPPGGLDISAGIPITKDPKILAAASRQFILPVGVVPRHSNGADWFKLTPGAAVRAPIAGQVTVNQDGVGQYFISITAPDGFRVAISDVAKLAVKPGQTVRAGQLIGTFDSNQDLLLTLYYEGPLSDGLVRIDTADVINTPAAR